MAVAFALLGLSAACGDPDGGDDLDASSDPGNPTGGSTGGTGGTETTGGDTGTATTGGMGSGGPNGGSTGTGAPTTGGTNPTTGGSNANSGGTNPTTGGANGSSGGTNPTTGGGNSSGGANSSTGGNTGGSTGGGACKTGPGAAFPPIMDYSVRDGGFGPAVTERNTGDAMLGADKVAVFRPAAAKYGQNGVTHPVIVWGNGSTNTVDIWQGFLARVATYGFVVVAPEQTQVTAAHMNAALDYVLRLANDPASGDCGKIDATKLGSTGYSRGGGGAISVGSDARITSTFFFASNGNVKNLKAPWASITGELDTIFDWPALMGAVGGSTQPAFGAALTGVDHNRVAGNGKAQQAYIAWMRWRFMGDAAGKAMFVGPTCTICADTATYIGFVKTPTFDML